MDYFFLYRKEIFNELSYLDISNIDQKEKLPHGVKNANGSAYVEFTYECKFFSNMKIKLCILMLLCGFYSLNGL